MSDQIDRPGSSGTRCLRNRRRWRVVMAPVIAVLLLPLCASRAAAYIYWESSFYGGRFTIGRANLDGSAAKARFIQPAPWSCGGLALDRRYIYWTDGWIARARLDGKGQNDKFIRLPGYHYACALAVDRTDIYWFDQKASKIGRANLDGTRVNRSFISVTPGTFSSGLAVDRGDIYWLDDSATAQRGSIARASLDGSHVDRTFILANASDAGLAVDSGHTYWVDAPSDVNGAAIARASLGGRDVIPDFIKPIDGNCGTMAIQGGHITGTARTESDASNLDGADIRLGFIRPVSAQDCGVAVNTLRPARSAAAGRLRWTSDTVNRAGRVACGGVVVLAAPAFASSIDYLKGGNVWVASPDGAVQRQVTYGGGWISHSRRSDDFRAHRGIRTPRLTGRTALGCTRPCRHQLDRGARGPRFVPARGSQG